MTYSPITAFTGYGSRYQNGIKLSGIIYMHRISDFRVGGVSRRNLSMFRKLCGDETLRNVALVTNMWSEVTSERGAARERELRTDPLLFTYDELHTRLLARADRPELRVVDSPSHPAATRNAPAHQHNMVPIEALAMSAGRDAQQFADAWQEEIRKSMAGESDDDAASSSRG